MQEIQSICPVNEYICLPISEQGDLIKSTIFFF